MSLTQVSTPKRGKFFNYNVIEFKSTISAEVGFRGAQKEISSTCDEVAATLLFRRQEIMGTAIAVTDWYDPLNKRDLCLMNRLGSEMKMAGHAEVILRLDVSGGLCRDDEARPITIEQYLHYLELPESPSLEKGWDTLKAVLEEWQLPFLFL